MLNITRSISHHFAHLDNKAIYDYHESRNIDFNYSVNYKIKSASTQTLIV